MKNAAEAVDLVRRSSTKKLGIDEKRAQTFFIQCITSQMQKAGASPQAIAFTKQMNGEVYMGQFREMGKVDLATTVEPIIMDPFDDYFILVNGTPRIVYLWENVDKIDLTRDPLYPSLKRQYPNIDMWPIHDFMEMQNLAQGGQRFLFDFALRNLCRGCVIEGSAEIAFDFDAGGQFLGTKLVCLKEPSASGACGAAPIQTIPSTPRSVTGFVTPSLTFVNRCDRRMKPSGVFRYKILGSNKHVI